MFNLKTFPEATVVGCLRSIKIYINLYSIITQHSHVVKITINRIHFMWMISQIGLHFILVLWNTWSRDTADIITRYVQCVWYPPVCVCRMRWILRKKKTPKCRLWTTKPHNLYVTRPIDTFLFTFFYMWIPSNNALPPLTALTTHTCLFKHSPTKNKCIHESWYCLPSCLKQVHWRSSNKTTPTPYRCWIQS